MNAAMNTIDVMDVSCSDIYYSRERGKNGTNFMKKAKLEDTSPFSTQYHNKCMCSDLDDYTLL